MLCDIICEEFWKEGGIKMIKYYKLKLDDSIFWQSKVVDSKLTYNKKTYVPKCMNFIFFKQSVPNVFHIYLVV